MSVRGGLAPAGRDYRVDFWRGVALAMIFINHIPGTVYEHFTSRNYGFSDAAELFVFLAGFASAFAYGRLFQAGHPLIAAIKAWRRAGVLYLVHIMLTAMAVAIFAWATLATGQGGLMQRLALNIFVESPLETMVGFATLGHQLGYVNILPMYMVMLLLLPVHLALASIDRRLMLAAATALWLGVNLYGWNLPNFPMPGGWYFNPLAWQLIFACGLFAGLNRIATGRAFPYSPWLFALALAYALAAFATIKFEVWYYWQTLDLPGFLNGFDKSNVSMFRLLHVLSLVYLFANAAPESPFSKISATNPFVMLGRHALPIFALGTVLSLLAQAYKFGHEASFATDSLIILGGLAILFGTARYLDWWSEASKMTARSRDRIAVGAQGAMATPDAEPVQIPKT